MVSMPTKSPPGTLLVADVARIWTEERRAKKPDAVSVRTETVLRYLGQSRQENGRYKDKPMPLPELTGGGYMGTSRQTPWWPADQEQALRDWWSSRPGHGHGTGGRYAGAQAKTAAPAKRRKGTGRRATAK